MVMATSSPRAPTTIKMMPMVDRLTPATDAWMANVMIAPTAIRKMESPMPMACSADSRCTVAVRGYTADVTEIPEVDPGLSEHVVAIRNRFGLDGLREAQRLIAIEIAIFEDAYDDLEKL